MVPKPECAALWERGVLNLFAICCWCWTVFVESWRGMGCAGGAKKCQAWSEWLVPVASFLFYIFQKKNYRNVFLVSDFTVLYPYRPAGGSRDLYVNKYKFYLRRGPWQER